MSFSPFTFCLTSAFAILLITIFSTNPASGCNEKSLLSCSLRSTSSAARNCTGTSFNSSSSLITLIKLSSLPTYLPSLNNLFHFSCVKPHYHFQNIKKYFHCQAAIQ